MRRNTQIYLVTDIFPSRICDVSPGASSSPDTQPKIRCLVLKCTNKDMLTQRHSGCFVFLINHSSLSWGFWGSHSTMVHDCGWSSNGESCQCMDFCLQNGTSPLSFPHVYSTHSPNLLQRVGDNLYDRFGMTWVDDMGTFCCTSRNFCWQNILLSAVLDSLLFSFSHSILDLCF